MAQKASAPDIERVHPETLVRSLLIPMTCSARWAAGVTRAIRAGSLAVAEGARPGCHVVIFL